MPVPFIFHIADNALILPPITPKANSPVILFLSFAYLIAVFPIASSPMFTHILFALKCFQAFNSLYLSLILPPKSVLSLAVNTFRPYEV